MRRFDAPEALDMRFYEVRAKSALNRVPEASRMPFRWTINPYRGCTHACVYCFARPTHTYLDLDAGRDFEREIVVKVNVPEVLRARARAALVEGRARRARHEHRPVPVGRGPLPADARHLGGAARRREPVLGADEVAARCCATSTLLQEIAEVTDDQRVPLGADARREGLAGDRAAHAAPAARLEAVAELNRAGIPTGMLSPR